MTKRRWWLWQNLSAYGTTLCALIFLQRNQYWFAAILGIVAGLMYLQAHEVYLSYEQGYYTAHKQIWDAIEHSKTPDEARETAKATPWIEPWDAPSLINGKARRQ